MSASRRRADFARFIFSKASKRGLTFDDFGGYQNVVLREKELIETQLERRTELEAMELAPLRAYFSLVHRGLEKHIWLGLSRIKPVQIYDISGPSIVSKWVGDTEDLLRKIFDHAKSSESRKSIIFDEINSIAESRTGNSHEASRRLVLT